MGEETCGVCDRPRSEHDSPEVHHLFSLDGELKPKPVERKKPANAREHIVADPAEKAATRLAALLHTKGVLSDDELVWVLVGGVRPDGSHPAAGNRASGDIRTGAQETSS